MATNRTTNHINSVPASVASNLVSCTTKKGASSRGGHYGHSPRRDDECEAQEFEFRARQAARYTRRAEKADKESARNRLQSLIAGTVFVGAPLTCGLLQGFLGC